MKRLSSTNKPTRVATRKPTTAKVQFKSIRDRAAEAEDIDISMEPVEDIVYDRTFAFYGRQGTGKTTLAASFPKPLLLLDFRDDGTDSISDVKDVFVIRMKVWGAVEKLYWDIIENPEKYAHFKTIVLDTVTQMQAMAIADLIKQKGKGVVAGAWGSMTKGEWGSVSQVMKEQIDNYRDLPFTTVFLCQDKEAYTDEDAVIDEENVMPEIGPNLMKSVAKSLAAAVHTLGYTFLREKPAKPLKEGEEPPKKLKAEYQYCLRIGPHPIYATKVRKPKVITIPALIVNPTYQDVIDIIKGA